MKILLDESLPIRLKYDFGAEHEVFTVRDMNWLGAKNGILLRLIAEHGFEAFVTVDKNLPYQNYVHQLTFTIIILNSVNNRVQTLSSKIPLVLERIREGGLGSVEIFR